MESIRLFRPIAGATNASKGRYQQSRVVRSFVRSLFTDLEVDWLDFHGNYTVGRAYINDDDRFYFSKSIVNFYWLPGDGYAGVASNRRVDGNSIWFD